MGAGRIWKIASLPRDPKMSLLLLKISAESLKYIGKFSMMMFHNRMQLSFKSQIRFKSLLLGVTDAFDEGIWKESCNLDEEWQNRLLSESSKSGVVSK